MKDFSNRTKHDVVMGRKSAGAILEGRPVGHALNFEGTNYFVLKLWERPKDTYFISRNRDDESSYTVFAKKVEVEDESGNVKFQNPIGYARLKNDLRTHLEVTLTLSRVQVYMSLFPGT